MEKDDSFLKKLQPLSDLPRLMDKRSRFATYNEKTMGFVLVRILKGCYTASNCWSNGNLILIIFLHSSICSWWHKFDKNISFLSVFRKGTRCNADNIGGSGGKDTQLWRSFHKAFQVQEFYCSSHFPWGTCWVWLKFGFIYFFKKWLDKYFNCILTEKLYHVS